jgi:SAM-dependent methyltransferase
MYNFIYRFSRPRWDTNTTPPEVRAVIEGDVPLPVGRALDLGCGTGTNSIYLTQHGWETVGVDFSPVAIEQAQQKGGQLPGVKFIEGDVTRLSQLQICGPFDFVLDIGCYHGLEENRRQAYAREVATVTRPGAIYMIWAIAERMTSIPGAPTMQAHEIADRFGQDFALETVESAAGRWKASWYTLHRK